MTARALPRFVRAVVRIASWVVPRRMRTRWRDEWLAEFMAMLSARGRHPRMMRRVATATMDAFAARWDTRGHSASSHPSIHSYGRVSMFTDLVEDLRFGARNLMRAPGFALVAILTIALGIGATATIFSIVDAIMWRPMPYPEANRVVAVWPGRSFSPEEVVRLEEELRSFSSIAAYVSDGAIYDRTDRAEYLYGSSVSAQFFDVLGRPADLGRTFAGGEDKTGANPVALVSHGFWVSEMGSDSGAIGQTIALDRKTYTVIGVLPRDLDVLQRDARFVRPLTMSPESPNFTGNWVNVVGRLAPDVTEEQARQELQRTFVRWREEFGYGPNFGNTASVVPVQAAVTASVRGSMLLLMGAVLLTLLVATSNLANLLLNRALTRNQELAIRGALGARPGRLLRQLLTESTLITTIGGTLGVLSAVWGVRSIVAILPETTPRLEYVALDLRVLVFSVTLILITGWLAGLFPGLQMRRPQFSALHASTRGSSESQARRRFRRALVITELALSVILLVGSAFLLRSLRAMNEVETGLEPDRLLTFGLTPTTALNSGGADGVNQYYNRILEAVAAVPGVESADAIHVLPVGGGGWNSSINVEGRATAPDAPYLGVWWRPITPGYIATAGMRLIRGRGITESDLAASPWVAVINESMARQFWPNEDPLGRRFQYNMEGGVRWITVIGVVENVAHLGLTNDTPPTVYRPFAQAGEQLNRMRVTGRWVVVRTAGNPSDAMESIRRTVVEVAPETPVVRLQPMTAVIQRSLADPRALGILLTLFAGSAVLLGAIGLYGVVAYTVRQRTRELGIRLALGASDSSVIRSVIAQGLGYAAVGLPLGLFGAWIGSRLIADLLFQVSTTDPVTYLVVSAVLVATVLAATIVPAWNAGKTDPITSLRTE